MMAPASHSFGPACAFHDDPDPFTPHSDEPSSMKAQFFYISHLPIDDPLSPVPSVQTENAANIIPQPFSIRDNAALERAWLNLQRQSAGNGQRLRPESRGLTRMTSFPAFESGLRSPEQYSPTAVSSIQGILAGKSAGQQNDAPLQSFGAGEGDKTSKSSKKPSPKLPHRSSIRSTSSRSRKTSQTNIEDQIKRVNKSEDNKTDKPNDIDSVPSSDNTGSIRRRPQTSPLRQRRRQGRSSPESSFSMDVTEQPSAGNNETAGKSNNAVESDISGRPFARAPSSRHIIPASTGVPAAEDSPTSDISHEHDQTNPRNLPGQSDRGQLVAVGVSRLHLVQFPEMQMKPIYWNPVNDISSVIRATWFYKDTMLPVPADVANRLEQGYEDMRPYADTYQDELDACIEHGAVAELKVVYKLWPDEKTSSPPTTSGGDKSIGEHQTSTHINLPKSWINVAADPRSTPEKKHFESYSVIYVNARDAQILRPNALPSISRNRTPLNSVRKGRSLGIAVVRGFDSKMWRKLHPNPKHDAKVAQAQIGAIMAQVTTNTTASLPTNCPKCDEDESSPKISDLVLVIHGIGQKLSERVDSYHFTHAINGLRREFNMELANESVRGTVGQDKGMMVLPVNWRLTVDFDEGQQKLENHYGLNDITPESLPAVRSLISDVMLDIPYFMSHHKSKMTAAVIREANRVYRLWCENNPGFKEYGRVHVVAHSLGSVMAMEILSNQPTFVSKQLDLSVKVPSETSLEFDTTNLFCCGSPSGFFLLLNDANLIPRRGRSKPGMEGEDLTRGVAGEQGRYGCLAVDNIYNICHRNDPIAYCQNACVDRGYAASLQSASIPSATQSLFGRIGNSLRWTSHAAQDAYGSVSTTSRPPMAQMPSTVELETHNFTKEEVAEKRMFLLNDNGQIDYFLNSGGGPLEIQYLNMLGAHSSYWILRDFVRFLVVEIGRKPGKANTLPALRATKKREYKRGSLA